MGKTDRRSQRKQWSIIALIAAVPIIGLMSLMYLLLQRPNQLPELESPLQIELEDGSDLYNVTLVVPQGYTCDVLRQQYDPRHVAVVRESYRIAGQLKCVPNSIAEVSK